MTADALIQALAAKTGFEAVQVSGSDSHMRLVGRVAQARMNDLMSVFDRLLASTSASWTCDLSKWYFKPQGMNSKVYAWRFIFEAKQGLLPIDEISGLIQSVPSAPRAQGGGPLDEIKLVGSSALRNTPNRNGKGAAPMGQAIVGPMRKGY